MDCTDCTGAQDIVRVIRGGLEIRSLHFGRNASIFKEAARLKETPNNLW